MGQIRKINDTYYIEFYARGLLYSQIAGNDLETARDLLLQIEGKIERGENLTISRHIELQDFFRRFLAEATTQHGSSSVRRFSSTIRHFSDFLRNDFPKIHQLDQVVPSVVESYKADLARAQKAKIVNLSVLLLRDILEFGIKLGFINDNPGLHVRLLPWPKSTERKMTERCIKAKQLLSQGVSISKAAQLLNLSDMARLFYFAHSIPLSREDAYI